MRISAILLAAGGSTRMRRNKLLLPWRGATVLGGALAALLDAGVEDVVVVLGHQADAVRTALPDDPRLRVVLNDGWREGLSASLRLGLEACGAADAVLVALADEPDVSPETVRRLMAAGRGGSPLVLPVSGDRAGHPVLFARALFDELRALRGDAGAREVVRRHLDRAARVDAAPAHDVDTDADYEALRAGAPAAPGRGLRLPGER